MRHGGQDPPNFPLPKPRLFPLRPRGAEPHPELVLLMAKPATRKIETPLDEILSRRILVLDGAMGTMIFARQPTEEDYRGDRFARHPHDLKNCTEVLVLTQPSMIEEIHTAYLEAGADIIETDTFNATPCRWPSSAWRTTSSRSTGPPPRSPAAPPTR